MKRQAEEDNEVVEVLSSVTPELPEEIWELIFKMHIDTDFTARNLGRISELTGRQYERWILPLWKVLLERSFKYWFDRVSYKGNLDIKTVDLLDSLSDNPRPETLWKRAVEFLHRRKPFWGLRLSQPLVEDVVSGAHPFLPVVVTICRLHNGVITFFVQNYVTKERFQFGAGPGHVHVGEDHVWDVAGFQQMFDPTGTYMVVGNWVLKSANGADWKTIAPYWQVRNESMTIVFSKNISHKAWAVTYRTGAMLELDLQNRRIVKQATTDPNAESSVIRVLNVDDKEAFAVTVDEMHIYRLDLENLRWPEGWFFPSGVGENYNSLNSMDISSRYGCIAAVEIEQGEDYFGTEDLDTVIFDLETKEVIQHLPSAHGVHFSFDGTLLYLNHDTFIRVYSTENWEHVDTIPSYAGHLMGICISSDTNVLVQYSARGIAYTRVTRNFRLVSNHIKSLH